MMATERMVIEHFQAVIDGLPVEVVATGEEAQDTFDTGPSYARRQAAACVTETTALPGSWLVISREHSGLQVCRKAGFLMQETGLGPYSFGGAPLPRSQGGALPSQAQGVYITLHPDVVDDIAEKMARWFAGREEIDLVDMGTSDKQGLGFIIIEWLACEIDPLFLAILRDEELVGDYTVYGRNLEG